MKITRFILLIIFIYIQHYEPVFAESYLFEKTKSDSTLIAYLNECGIQTTNNNEVEILKSGHDKFIDLFEEIKKAKHHIHLEYFNFRNDSIANLLFDLLGQKAQEGVEIRAIYDAFGNSSNNKPLKKKHIKQLREKGIDIVPFDPIKFPWINHAFHRDHRKIVVIDGIVGYTGGMNIADYYITGLPEIGEWRDIHIRLKGKAVEDLQYIFLDMWHKITKENIEGDIYYPYKNNQTFASPGDKEVAIVDRKPKHSPKTLKRAYAKAIESAEDKVQIINPYFTPTRIIRKAIKKAVKNGVKVEIMIPGKSDISFTPDAALYLANKLRKKGVDIYIFHGGFHHSKIMMIDSTYCTVGSMNLNSRSLNSDYETNAFIFNEETTAELIEIFEEDQKNCTLLTKEIYKKRSVWKKLWAWFAHLFIPVI